MAKSLSAWLLVHVALFLVSLSSIQDPFWFAACCVSSFVLAIYIKRQDIQPFSNLLAFMLYTTSAMYGIAGCVLFFSAHITYDIILTVIYCQYKASLWITFVEVAIFIGWTDSELRKRHITSPAIINSSG